MKRTYTQHRALNKGEITELQAILGELERIRARLRWIANPAPAVPSTFTTQLLYEAATNLTPALSSIRSAILEGSATPPEEDRE